MPIYEFKCDACKRIEEISCSLSEHDKFQKKPPKCSKCGKPMYQKRGSFGIPGWSTSKGIQGARSVEMVKGKGE